MIMDEVRLIDSETLKSRIGELCMNNEDMFTVNAYKRIIGVIEAVPTIDAEPIRHGRWIDWSMCGKSLYQCSECNAEMKYKTNFCPRCGAKMQTEPPEIEGGAENG